jgi:molybdopterin synthase sulfur carrier subunit
VPQLTFTENLVRHVSCPSERVAGSDVRAALDAYFARHPEVRGYVLDEQGCLRKHVVVFIDGRQLRDRATLSDAVLDDSELYVMQALSGG